MFKVVWIGECLLLRIDFELSGFSFRVWFWLVIINCMGSVVNVIEVFMGILFLMGLRVMFVSRFEIFCKSFVFSFG